MLAPKLSGRRLALACGFIAVIVVAAAFGRPLLGRLLPGQSAAKPAGAAKQDDHAGHDHDEHDDHDHEGHAEDEPGHEGHDHSEHAEEEGSAGGGEHRHDEGDVVVELTPQALKNIGFRPFKTKLGEYQRTVSMPGMVVERPGRTQLTIAAPLGGVVTRVYVIPGEAVAPGAPLFDVRLTHEELVSAQGEYLRTLEELDVVNREITRLEGLTEGVVAGSRTRDQKYRRQQLEASLRAQRQALLLHGLSESDVDKIVNTRLLLQALTIRTPAHDDDTNCGADHMYHVQSLSVQRGQQVDPGASLCVLADHCELFIEGIAFEQDAARLREAATADMEIAAHERVQDVDGPIVDGLKILYIADQVDPESRALHFYVTLPNEVAFERTDNGRRFQQWKYKPGQRMELHVPVEWWSDRLVVPAEAVVTEGAESYVYVEEGAGHFHRMPVHVEHRDQTSAVIGREGGLHAGDTIASRGAFQIHLHLKNQLGGGVDPHAGHNH